MRSSFPRFFFLILLALGAGSPAAARSLKPADRPAVCTDVTFDGDSNDDDSSGKAAKGKKKGGSGVKFDLAGACAKLSGTLAVTNQNNLTTTAGGVPALIGRNGQPSNARYINTLEANATIETKRKTALGDLETTFSSRWAKTSDDGTSPGTATVQELKGSLKGGTVGYTDSLMNFWNEDFLFTATSPKRTVGIASYEHDITDDAKLAIAIESGLPTSRQYNQGIAAIDFDSPIATARGLYENDDDWSFQLSGLLRQAAANTGAGWATTLGATMPAKVFGDSDYVSMQATYAVNASPFLGTASDLSSLSSILPSGATTRGWSMVTSFHHEWSAQWETNAFVSYLTLNAETARAQPMVRTKRYGVNLYWRPIDSFRLGAELGRVETELAANGPVGFLSGVSGQALVGYLNAQWSF